MTVETITITRSHQPSYTVETWVIESHSPVIASDSDPEYIKARAKAGWVNVQGRIINSVTKGRLFNVSTSKTHKYIRPLRDVVIADQPLCDQMPSKYLKDGSHFITVAKKG